MLEVTIRRVTDKLATTKTQAFQFENDALQAFMTEAGPEVGYSVAELRVLGSPVVAAGQRIAEVTQAKTAGPGAPRTQDELDAQRNRAELQAQALRTQAPGINTPIQEQARSGKADHDADVAQTQTDANNKRAAAAAEAGKPDRADPRRPGKKGY